MIRALRFTESESRFLSRNELCRLATIGKDGMPHLVPVCYIFKENKLYIVSDPETAKVRNVKRDKRVTLLVDQYQPNKAVLIYGEAEIIEGGNEFYEISSLFYKKFTWARRDPWDEGEVSLIKVKPLRKLSWGLR